jgi:hypothetical protein
MGTVIEALGEPVTLEPVRAIPSEGVTHLRHRVVRD